MTAFFLRYSYVAIIQRAYLRLIVDIIRHARLYNLRVISGLSAKIPRSVSKKKEERKFYSYKKRGTIYIYIETIPNDLYWQKNLYDKERVAKF